MNDVTVDGAKLQKALESAEKRYMRQFRRRLRPSKTLARIAVQRALEIYRDNKSFDDGNVIRLALNDACIRDVDERRLYSKIIASYFGQLSGHARRNKNKKTTDKSPKALEQRNTSPSTRVEEGSGQIEWVL